MSKTVETIKTKSGRVLILPTRKEDAAITAVAENDPDAVPLTDAQWQDVLPTLRRGRPLGSGNKVQVTLRLDIDVLEKLKEGGAGWQTRANAALRRAVLRPHRQTAKSEPVV
jgi:uncharacterized protein (DUF4415 family)